eukprot:TRINITY_DN194_c0_g2_i1.p2 TRINITY_DN194_c0_g2~~TRINITY_DN194_c0_g2_i1.p2  ORF type:complete len:227 (+),score=48.52 TRINITY_DN194_c0_g2_i1:37-717(+)
MANQRDLTEALYCGRCAFQASEEHRNASIANEYELLLLVRQAEASSGGNTVAAAAAVLPATTSKAVFGFMKGIKGSMLSTASAPVEIVTCAACSKQLPRSMFFQRKHCPLCRKMVCSDCCGNCIPSPTGEINACDRCCYVIQQYQRKRLFKAKMAKTKEKPFVRLYEDELSQQWLLLKQRLNKYALLVGQVEHRESQAICVRSTFSRCFFSFNIAIGSAGLWSFGK